MFMGFSSPQLDQSVLKEHIQTSKWPDCRVLINSRVPHTAAKSMLTRLTIKI
jgi:hypothetical protein